MKEADKILLEGLIPSELFACDSTVLVKAVNSSTLFIYNVNTDHKLSKAGIFDAGQNVRSFACSTINHEMYVALTNEYNLKLYKLVTNPGLNGNHMHKLIRWSHYAENKPIILQFSGTYLIVAVRRHDNRHAIELLCVEHGNLIRTETLLTLDAGLEIYFWSVQGNRILMNTSEDLRIYKYEKYNHC